LLFVQAPSEHNENWGWEADPPEGLFAPSYRHELARYKSLS
jgi:hypothetical protein